MKLDTYFERDGESGRATLPPAEELQREEDRGGMAVVVWMLGAFAFTFAVVTVWAVA